MKKINNMSLVALMQEDKNFARRINSVKSEIEKDTTKIKSMADSYNKKYNKEITDGTARKHLLLEDGIRAGKSVEEIEQSSGFIPSVYTPVLNWLYFFMREDRNLDEEYTREEQDVLYKTLLQEEKSIQSIEDAPDMLTYIYGNITMEKFQTLKKLKRLSKSPNENEAFQAYRKCLELCREHKIEFDRIPD